MKQLMCRIVSEVLGYVMVCVIIAAFLALITITPSQKIDFENHYCEMVGIWKSQSNLPEHERSGWPPHRPEITCN